MRRPPLSAPTKRMRATLSPMGHEVMPKLLREQPARRPLSGVVALYTSGVCLDAGVVLLPSLATRVTPMMVGALFMCGQGLGLCGVVIAWRPVAGLGFTARTVKRYISDEKGMIVRQAAGRSAHWFLLLSVALAGPSIAAIIWGAAPIVWAFALRRDARHRYRPIRGGASVGLMVAFVGCCLVIAAQPHDVRSDVMMVTAGVTVAVLGILIDSQSVISVRWGFELAERLGKERDHITEAWGGVLGTGIGGCTIGVVLLAVALTLEGVPVEFAQVGWCLLGGATLGLAVIAARLALPRTDKSTINSVGFLGPAVSVGYLAMFGMLASLRLSYLLVGVALVMAGGTWSLHSRKISKAAI